MSKGIPQSQDDLERHFREQLGFLERSAVAFDDGHVDEAKRLAVTIRTLVHDRGTSHSLLSQLNRKDIDFVDSAFAADPSSLVAHAGLVGISVGAGSVRHVAPLDGDDPSRFGRISFQSWWNGVVIRDKEGRELTRQDLVLAVANQDGGAHVDPTLNEEYARLTRDHSLGRFEGYPGDMSPLTGVELASIRQIAHEVLKTLQPDYERKPRSTGAAIIGNLTVHHKPHRDNAIGSVGRNDPCPCGSGKKYKKCHGSLSGSGNV